MATATQSKSKLIKLIIVAVATVFMFYCFFAAPFKGLEDKGMKYLGIFIWWIVLMATEIMPGYLACITALVVAIMAGISTVGEAFGSFAGSTCWLLIGAFGMAAALGNSGILKRLALYVMKLFPGTYTGQLWAVSIASIAIAPTVPSTTAKCTILIPIVGMISDELGYEPHSKGATGLISCCNTVTNFVGIIFMTGGIIAATMLAMYSGSFTWMGYLKFTIVWGIVLFFTTVLFHQFYYNPNKGKKKEDITVLDKKVIQARIEEMGKMSKKEIIALVVLLATVILWVTEKQHGIPTAVVALAAWIVLCCAGLFTPAEFSTRILWSVYALVGAVLGVIALLSSTGVSAWIGTLVAPAVSVISGSPFLIIIGCAVLACALMFGLINMMITATLFVTLLAGTSVDPFCILFATCTGASVFVLAFQQITVIAAVGVSGGRIEHKDIVPAAWAFVVCNLISLAVSVPYWQIIGFIK